MAKNVGVEAGRLHACPKDKNCVSSQDRGDAAHFIEPLRHGGDVAAAKEALRAILRELPRVRVVAEDERYWHIEFRSRLFGFVDDVELLFDANEPVIHVRSASRFGTYDWGVNRRRVEDLRRRLEARSKRERRDAPVAQAP